MAKDYEFLPLSLEIEKTEEEFNNTVSTIQNVANDKAKAKDGKLANIKESSDKDHPF